MNDEEALYIAIAGSVLALLLMIIIFLVPLILYYMKWRCRRKAASERVRGCDENWNESMSVSQSTHNETRCSEGQTERDQNIDNMAQEQVFQIHHESPRPEPSAPPLPPEYFIDYT